MLRKLMICTKGVMLFEVLLAVLVLAIGITGSLQAFNSIVQVTKRSRDLFESGFVASDLYFSMFALPENIPDLATGIKEEYTNTGMQLQKDYFYISELTDVPLPQPDEGESDLPGVVREELISFVRNKMVVSNKAGALYVLETFHSIPNEEE